MSGRRIDGISIKAIRTFGSESQIDMCIEECAELIDALQKYKRQRNTIDDVITEIADVTIMACQMQHLFGEIKTNREIYSKLIRLQDRIKEHESRLKS